MRDNSSPHPGTVDEIFSSGLHVDYDFPGPHDIPLEIVTVNDAALTAPVPPNIQTGEWHHPVGAVYDSNQKLVPLSRFRSQQILPDTLPDNHNPQLHLKGKWVYLGYYNEIYGHFILESLARLWALKHLPNEPLNFVFFAIRNYKDYEGKYTEKLFRRAGLLDRIEAFRGSRIEIIDVDAKIDELIIPSQSFDLQGGLSPELRSFSREITAPLARKSTDQRLYLSRGGVHDGNHRFVNEAELEKAYESLGFTIVRPEKIDIDEQLALYSGCSVMAGSMSSALHNSIFSHRDDLHVIALNGRWPVDTRRDKADKLAPDGGTIRLERLPVFLQDALAVSYGHRLTYVEAFRAFDIGGRIPGRMPYWIEPDMVYRHTQLALGEDVVGGLDANSGKAPMGFTVEAISMLTAQLATFLTNLFALKQAGVVEKLAREFGNDTAATKRRLVWRNTAQKARAVVDEVSLFPTMSETTRLTFEKRSDPKVVEMLHRLESALKSSSI